MSASLSPVVEAPTRNLTCGLGASRILAGNASTVATVVLLRLIRMILTHPPVLAVVIRYEDRRHRLMVYVDEDGDVPVVLFRDVLVGP